jgi:hypothetical protein
LIAAGAVAVLVLGGIGYFIANRNPGRDLANKPSASAPGPEQASVLTGVWRNTDMRNSSDSLITLRINGTGPAYNVEPIGQCPQGKCPWGSRTLTFNGGRATGVWTPQNTPQEINQKRTVTLTLQPVGGKLNVQVKNTFGPEGNTKPRSNNFLYVFERQP